MRHLICGTVLGGLIVVQGGLASAQQIVPNGLGTQVTVNGQQFDITGGTRAGANLFHSFAKFGLSQAQIAHFLSNPAIRNILARVTGGEVSVINGLIKVTGGNSNLYLMNPAGIVFGQGASLNVPAAFHATTANAIKIGNGYFGMNTTAAELALLTAEPNGYAFSSLNQNLNPGTPAGVILNQADLSVNPGQTIVLAGNQVINTGTIQSPNGTVVITATADGKFVNVSQSGSILSLDLPVAVNQDIALQNLRPVLPSDIPQLLTGTAYVSGTISTASTVKNPDSLINITGERVILDKANLDNLGTDGLIQIRVAPGITSEGYVFLDRVRNYEQLVNALAPGSTAYLINKTDSGVEKVNQVVAKNGAVQRIDIVGDGNTGQIWFGRDFITVDTLPQYETQIAQWGQGLTGSREIYLYACNLAASVAGKELVGEIGNLTNSTVLASTDITGSGQYGGNWQFEYSTGNVAGQLVFDAQAVQSADVKLQTFTVLNNSDTGSGSLRQAISDANAASGADSIAFAPATNGTPIVLTTGELRVTDPAGLTITGNGATNTIIDGNNTSRVFNITAGDITFNGVTIRNGNTPGDGGGILANGNVTLNNSTMSNNQATGGYGGGIYAVGNATLTNSTVSNNQATGGYGGGIYAVGNATLTNSTVSNNQATGGFSGGGGIYAVGNATLTNSTVSNNQATGQFSDGGGIYAVGNATLTNSTVSNNQATGQFSDGGGILANGTVILNNSTVAGNTAGSQGGGILANGTVILNNSTVSGNEAGATGGGINTQSGGTIRNSTIAFNTANESGGIFNVFGTLNIGNSIVAKNTAGTSPDIGSSSIGTGYTNAGNNLIGINTGFEATFPASSLVGTASSPVDPLLAPLADNGGATQTHALLPGSPAINAGNNALIPSGVTTDQRGEGFARIVGGTVDIGAFEVQSISPIPNPPDFSNLIVTNGNDSGAGSLRLAILTANDLAGADTITFSGNFTINLTSGELTVTDPAGLTITGNGQTNTIIDGNNTSRVFNITAGDITFNGVTIRNGNTTGDGGGILAKGNVTLTNSTVSSNTAGTRGGGIYADGNATLTNSTVSGNTSGSVGGGIYAENATLINSTVSGNTAGAQGGGIFAYLGTVTLTNSTVSNNQATYGGGIFAYFGTVTLTNSTVSNNQATGQFSGGGGIFADNATLTNSTVSGNTSSGDGGGIFARFNATLTNSTVSNNQATGGSGGGGGIFADNATLTDSTVSNNQATGGFGGGGGIYAVGNATLTNSTVSNNQATGQFSGGGGIFADNATLTDSTVSNNQATGGFGGGGGIYAVGNATLTNSTVSNNQATGGFGGGGGIFANGGGTIRNSTIAFNTAKDGGGIFSAGGTIDIGNSIVAKNTAATSPDIGSESIGTGYTNAGNNLIGINTGFEATFPASPLVGTASSPVDPLLAPLADNGGATQTHALLPGSPAINAGNNALIPAGVTTDQRGAGFDRIVGGTVDIGAFEAQVVTPPPAPPDNPTPPSSDTPPRSALREESEAPKNTDQTLFGQEFVTPNFDFGLDAIEDVALGDFIARFNIAEALGTGDFEAILTLDTLFTGEFDRFLGVNPINDLNSVEKIGNMLSRLAQETGKKPAIVYLMVDERQLTIAAIPPGSRAGVARAGLVASTEPFAQREAQVQPVVRGIPEAKRANLMPVVERFLTALKDPRQRTSTAYLKDAQQLYRWFIAPIEQELQAQGIDTLLFSMDNGLRLLPVAALHDGQQFLVEKYSTALIPSVNLIDTRYRNLRDGRVLAMGADTFANQTPLPAVPVELKVITEEWPGQSFLNQEFTVQRLTQERLQGGYPIIHLATHADFAPGRLSDSYIEFGNNQRLNLPQLRQLPLREPNVVELLTLSACRTSVGDVSAELGFAGLAVQAGVKSALASLWYVSDEGTLALMSEFYKNLRQAPIKAEALRQAQIAMLQGKVTIKGGELRGVRGGIPVPSAIAQRGDQVLNHPYYWAAFTLIGSPW